MDRTSILEDAEGRTRDGFSWNLLGQFVQHIFDSGALLDREFNPGNKAFFEPFMYYVLAADDKV